jgi:hypothetical protein
VPLAPPNVARTPIHTRRIEFQGYERADGLWDIEARLVDVKPFDCPLESGVRPGGDPIHDMTVRLTIDEDFNVRDAQACMDWMPYQGYCSRITPSYSKLVGLNLRRSFRKRVTELYSGVEGCTHLTEMLSVLPTAAIQALFVKPADSAAKPFQLDRCHALDTAGEAAARYYPKWYAPRTAAQPKERGDPT